MTAQGTKCNIMTAKPGKVHIVTAKGSVVQLQAGPLHEVLRPDGKLTETPCQDDQAPVGTTS